MAASPPPDRSVRDAHDRFVQNGTLVGESSDVRSSAAVRRVVADSWVRSAAAGVDAEFNVAPIVRDRPELAEYRSAHPLSAVFPVLYDVLGRAAEASDSLMAISDADGQLLWVCGNRLALARAERINFVEGAAWDEAHAGTNAPGTALRLDAPIQIHGSEHFSLGVQQWSCAAAPIHDPVTKAILGIVDITGGEDIGSPMTMGLIRAAAMMAESELARLNATSSTRANQLWAPRESELWVEALGRPDCQLEIAGRIHRLSPRHSEIIVLLADRPEGMTGDELAIELYREDITPSTLRAELTRLRALLGPNVLDSRPYRLRTQVHCDWLAVGAHLAAGRVGEALRCFRGPLLPQSEAPGIVERRARLENQLRAAIVASGQPDLMVAWTRTRWGADDLEMWQRQAIALPATSPLRPLAVAEARRLDAALRAAPLQRPRS
jgi:hypothetical protein